jgi:hypothetical protein
LNRPGKREEDVKATEGISEKVIDIAEILLYD